jgi:hypothetical protein
MTRYKGEMMGNLRGEFDSKLWNTTRRRSNNNAGELHTAGIQNATGRSHKFKLGVEMAGTQQPAQIG